MWAKRTHCKRMHPLRGDNLYISPSGARLCKACRKAYKAAHRLAQGLPPRIPIDPTRCRRGHPFDAENTVIKKSGQRKCRICMTATAKAYNAKRNYDGDNAKRRKPGGLADRHRTAGAIAERAKIFGVINQRIAIHKGFINGCVDHEIEAATSILSALVELRSLLRELTGEEA